MEDSLRKRILQDVVDTLGTIQVVNGYKHDVDPGLIFRAVAGGWFVKEYPAIFVIAGADNPIVPRSPFGQIDWWLTITIEAWIRMSRDTLPDEAEDMLADLRQALLKESGTQRAGAAIDTWPGRSYPPVINEAQDPRGVVRADFLIRYRHAWQDPYSFAP